MNKFFLYIILCFFNIAVYSQQLNIMTYNIRFDNPDDGINAWDNRREYVLDQINFYKPDIIGTQEGKKHQLKWLKDNLINFEFAGVDRDEGTKEGPGEFCAIFYNEKKFSLLNHYTFWLSEIPDKPSKSWDAAFNRVCTSVLLKEIESGKIFWVFNTHLDHVGTVAQQKSAELILDQIKILNEENYPAFLIGDFNLSPEQTAIQKIINEFNDSREATEEKPFGPEETFCGWDICILPERRIDYIFTSKENIQIKKYATFIDIFDLRYPSDHLPVYVEAELK